MLFYPVPKYSTIDEDQVAKGLLGNLSISITYDRAYPGLCEVDWVQ